MEAEASRSSGSADSYIGSLISLTSKSEIRYEGLLFNINASESTIGLTNVRSFGTEGRKKDGPQVSPSPKVFEYILFRGSDIKDLQVKASPPVQPPAPMYNDPAIIQSHYPQTSSTTTSFPSTVTGSLQDLSPHTSQLGVPKPTFQGSLPLHQPGGNSGSWASSLPLPTPNANGLATQLYWQGYYGPSDGLQAQQQSLLQPPLGLSAPPPIQYRMEYTEFPAHMHVPPTLGTSIPPVCPLSTVWDSSANPPFVPEKPKIDTASAMLYTTVSEAEPYVAGTSGSFLNEGSTPSLVTPDQLLPPGITKASISQSSQTAQKDVEVVQGSASGPPVPTVVESQAPIMPRHPTPDHKSNGAPSHTTHHHNRGGHGRVRGHELNGAPSHTHHNNRGGHGRRRGNELSEAPSHTHQNNGGGQGRIRGNELSGAPSHTNHNNRGGHGRIRRDELSEAPSHPHHNNRGHGRVRRNETSHQVTKFTEDFDFTAMNEKFNKYEVWGHLGKTSKAQEEGDGYEDEADVGPSKLESKSVYVKDDFFDYLSCDALGSRNGRTKFSEQVKVDTETFGEFARHRGGRSGRGFGRAGHSRGSYYGRSYGYYMRGRGHRTYAGMAESRLPD